MGKGLSGSWLVGREGLRDPLGQSSVLYISSHLAGSIRVRLSWHKLNQENLHLRKRHSSEILFFFFFFFFNMYYLLGIFTWKQKNLTVTAFPKGMEPLGVISIP